MKYYKPVTIFCSTIIIWWFFFNLVDVTAQSVQVLSLFPAMSIHVKVTFFYSSIHLIMHLSFLFHKLIFVHKTGTVPGLYSPCLPRKCKLNKHKSLISFYFLKNESFFYSRFIFVLWTRYGDSHSIVGRVYHYIPNWWHNGYSKNPGFEALYVLGTWSEYTRPIMMTSREREKKRKVVQA